ncbi:MAG: hypothetical protein JJT76_09335 [Clostridiaceae bacterium]|nr:hypothetical protein [Clostridiaceae bacterium]
MKEWISKAFGSTKQYTMWDFALLKVCLFSMGILFGVYFGDFFLSYLSIVWIIFIASYVYIMYKTFGKHLKNRR